MRILVVGQGLAGTLVSHAALQRGWDCHVMDSGQPSASSVAAGMFNPMSFRRIIEVWEAQAHLDSMTSTYRAFEAELGESFLHFLPILKQIPNAEYAEEWNRKALDSPWIEPVRSDAEVLQRFPDAVPSPGHGYGLVQGGGWLDLPRLIQAWRDRLMEEGRFQPIPWSAAKAQQANGGGWDAIIDCRGCAAALDPTATPLDIRANRGEILTVKPDGSGGASLPDTHILNFGKWTLPTQHGSWRLGASYEWNRTDLDPTPETRDFLLASLSQAAPNAETSTTVRHDVGLRPVSKDRRPAVGPHPSISGLHVFNGLGTRGVLIGPRWADLLCDSLSGKCQLPDIVNPVRLI
ncbi:MAG: NAD(P)/FAD-dependent oxidoreductase [Flavobacteriales bacterium]